MLSNIIDISQPMRPSTPVWPGDTPFSIEETWTISDVCPVRVSRMTLSTHTGTHADAHSHYDEHGIDSASRELTPYIGPCLVIDVAGGTSAVDCDDVLPVIDTLDTTPERILVRTFETFPLTQWPTDFRAISAELVDVLGARGCQLIGTDAPSIDPETSKTMDAHHAVNRHGMAILEGLVLDAVTPGAYELIALPLRIEKADATPVRAVLRPLGDALIGAAD
ncbi:MAG: arylformamidase [Pseudomonadota bacterium]